MSLHRVDILRSATRTVSGTGDLFDFSQEPGGSSQVLGTIVQLVVTAASGTAPTLDVFVQMEMPDGSWNDLVAFTRVDGTQSRTAAVRSRSEITDAPVRDAALVSGSARDLPLGPRYRAKWVIGGVSPSFTFAVKADLYD